MPHDESKKFIMICEENYYLERKPFENRENGPLNVVSRISSDSALNNFSELVPVGRNQILYDVIQQLNYNEIENKRVIHIYGIKGVGKTFIAKYAAKYLIERGNFSYG